MAARSKQFQFRISAYTLKNLPMARLAEYMQDIAAILGSRQHVHFVGLKPGSAVVVGRVDAEVVETVKARTDDVRLGIGTPEAMGAFHKINERLREDRGTAELRGLGKIVPFPGHADDEEGTLIQEEVLDGVVIRLGGQSKNQPVHIRTESGVISTAYADEETIKRLGHFIHSKELRFNGRGRWRRKRNGEWELLSFRIATFTQLDETPLADVVRDLRAIGPGDWRDAEDPWEELKRIRRGAS